MSHRLLLLLAFVSALPCRLTLADDFNQWRGPARDGRIAADDWPAAWPEALEEAWAVEVGEGHASPVLQGEKVFQFSRQGEDELLRCLDAATGKEVWVERYAAPYEMHPAARGHGKGPKSTPAVVDGRVYTFGISGVLQCRSAETGKLEWSQSFAGQYKATSPLYGAAQSPLVVEGRCIVHVGGHDDGALMAFHAQSGEVLWTTALNGPGYASPILATAAGRPMIVTQTQDACVGVDPAQGAVLWSHPFKTPYDQNSVTPVLLGGNRILFGGIRQKTFALSATEADGKFAPKVEWEAAGVACYMSTPVRVGSHIYGFSHERAGHLFCLEAATGKVLWQGTPRSGENAAILASDKELAVLNTQGELRIYRANPEKEDLLRTYHLAETPTWAHPVIARPRVLVKARDHLKAFRLGG